MKTAKADMDAAVEDLIENDHYFKYAEYNPKRASKKQDLKKTSLYEHIMASLKKENLMEAVETTEEAIEQIGDRRAILRSITLGLSIGLSGTAAVSFASDLLATRAWESRKNDLLTLFMEGKPITVTEEELRSLVQIIRKHLQAKANPDIYIPEFEVIVRKLMIFRNIFISLR